MGETGGKMPKSGISRHLMDTSHHIDQATEIICVYQQLLLTRSVYAEQDHSPAAIAMATNESVNPHHIAHQHPSPCYLLYDCASSVLGSDFSNPPIVFLIFCSVTQPSLNYGKITYLLNVHCGILDSSNTWIKNSIIAF